jgi:hypothetical protein
LRLSSRSCMVFFVISRFKRGVTSRRVKKYDVRILNRGGVRIKIGQNGVTSFIDGPLRGLASSAKVSYGSSLRSFCGRHSFLLKKKKKNGTNPMPKYIDTHLKTQIFRSLVVWLAFFQWLSILFNMYNNNTIIKI